MLPPTFLRKFLCTLLNGYIPFGCYFSLILEFLVDSFVFAMKSVYPSHTSLARIL